MIENRYKMIIESERSGRTIYDVCIALSFKANMVRMEETLYYIWYRWIKKPLKKATQY
jgi:hypothetical protein